MWVWRVPLDRIKSAEDFDREVEAAERGLGRRPLSARRAGDEVIFYPMEAEDDPLVLV